MGTMLGIVPIIFLCFHRNFCRSFVYFHEIFKLA